MPSPPPKGPASPPKPPRRAAAAQIADLPEPSEDTKVIARPSARIHFDSPEDLIGHTLNNRYKILSLLGSGGMGTVYLAEHVLINKQVAIKVLSPAHSKKPDEVERFLREARAASRIRQENVVDITDFGYTSGGLAFLVMEYLEGEDLATTSTREGALPWRRAVRITKQICAALEAAHTGGIIHRDMKPENVFRIRRGADPDFIKVLDFGIAKIIDENYEPSLPSSTNSGLLGTPEYVAPELIRGLPPDARVDIYAVGVILYRLLTGRVPFSGDSFMATLTQHLMEPPRPLRQVAPHMDIPEALEAIVLRTLNKEPDQRYPAIGELSRVISAVDAAHPEHSVVVPNPIAAGATPAAPPHRRDRRRPRAAPARRRHRRLHGRQRPADARHEGRRHHPADRRTAARADRHPDPRKTRPAAGHPDPPDPVPNPAAADEAGEDPQDTPGKSDPDPSKLTPRAPLAERLTSIELRSKMDRLQDKVKTECARFAMKKMAVGLKISVNSAGKVQATPTGSQGGGLAECVVKVARSARYARTAQGGEFEYTFRM
jgi:serine/threonine protein kinase